MRASHFLQGGKKNPEVAGDGREGGGKVLGSDGKNKAVGFGKKDRLMERSSQCYFWRVPGEVWLQHVQCPERAGLNAFCSMHRATLCPSGSNSWQWTCSFYFCSHIHLPQCQLTLFQPSCTPAAQTTAGKAPRWVCSPSLPCSSSLRKFKLLIFRFF